ncbi:fatty acyl-AMP ligase [Pelobacter propionicus]|uniref:AMP-dependent synthetase and ligase n=1 Tax=Pelobacter propionicus (strain DSM 2379 / NBRC 103807 / OttBd1) TaxID=338966 RepID=A1ASP9_PELPD|nr:fatty acyl-AMP ligase [Pelobacter propionicus]ABL00370.1 AMP-dependent synthetase and ligase [Pelobacter propionicus DSM 2379]
MHTLKKTPTNNSIALRRGDFNSLPEALDYAAEGRTGFNFYSGKGSLAVTLPYSQMRDSARSLARKLVGLGLSRGDRMALVAETDADFVRFFFACQYAGLVPVPLPAAVHLGGRQAIIDNLRKLVESCGARAAMSSRSFFAFLSKAAEGLDLKHVGIPDCFDALPEADQMLQAPDPEDVAYLQYTSGSTRFPRGVVITQKSIMANLACIISHGLAVQPGDRATSWLPFYHDMGLVGFMLAPMACQLSIDYLSTRDFAMRPRLWPALISKNRATISYSPTFGYALCARRLRPAEIEQYDLSSWRIAGTGAEPIRADILENFGKLLAPAGFSSTAYVASYGMAECSLAISFAPLGRGLEIDRIDAEALTNSGRAIPLEEGASGAEVKELVLCGSVIPGHEIEIRDEHGMPLPERCCGVLHVRGPSVMREYLGAPETTREVLCPDGWLNTGDLAYLAGGQVVITGRMKDLIIINGRNIWPQDIEFVVEQLPEIRSRDAAAFSIPGQGGEEQVVLVVQCRHFDETERCRLVELLRGRVREEFGVDCLVELVAPHTLPQTSSGKISRSMAKADYLRRIGDASSPARAGQD